MKLIDFGELLLVSQIRDLERRDLTNEMTPIRQLIKLSQIVPILMHDDFHLNDVEID